MADVNNWKIQGADKMVILTGKGSAKAATCRDEETAALVLSRVQAHEQLVAALEQIARMDFPQPSDIENPASGVGGTYYDTQVIALRGLGRLA